MATITDTHKAALKRFREQRKQAGEDPAQAAVRFRQQRKAVASALKNGPGTVPQLAEATGLPAHEVLWHLAGMRKYGAAQEIGQDGDYPRYARVDASSQAPAEQ
jgi:aryl-alcohol dehydrogenase-like predicted oxidoreductase